MGSSRRLWLLALAAAVFAVVLYVTLLNDLLLDPLPWDAAKWLGLGAALVALGLAGGRWWVALVAPISVVLASLGTYDLYFVVVLTPVWAGCAALGVLTSRRLRRNSRSVVAVAAVLVLLALAPLGWAAAIEIWPIDHSVAMAKPIDAPQGTYLGVGLGSSRREVERRFGSAPSWSDAKPVTPLGASPSAPGSYNCKGWGSDDFLRYEGVSFWQRGDVICSVDITDPDAETANGVGPGDSLNVAEERYPSLACHSVHGDLEQTPYRFCTGLVGRGVYLRVAGDPIDELELGNRPFPS